MGSDVTSERTPSVAVGDTFFESMGRIALDKAAFLERGKFGDGEDFLVATDFAIWPWVDGGLSICPNLKSAAMSGDVTDLEFHALDTSPYTLRWPQDVRPVPAEVFPGIKAIAVPDGFKTWGKSPGAVYIVQLDDDDLTKVTKTVKITPHREDYWFLTGEWVDMNGDGRLDYLASTSNGKEGEGELIWLEHPYNGIEYDDYWEPHYITDGPSTWIRADFLDNYPGEVIVWAAEYWNERLAVYRVSLETGTFIERRIIDDDDFGSAYSIRMVELNGDGKKQLLAHNWQKNEDDTRVYAYTVPDDLMNGEFERFTVGKNFEPVWNLFGSNRSPSFPYAIYPDGYASGKRAHIVVAGSGDYSATLLIPTGDDPSKFEYEKQTIVKTDGVIGDIETADLDEDGWLEMYMANYNDGYVEAFKMSAAP